VQIGEELRGGEGKMGIQARLGMPLMGFELRELQALDLGRDEMMDVLLEGQQNEILLPDDLLICLGLETENYLKMFFDFCCVHKTMYLRSVRRFRRMKEIFNPSGKNCTSFLLVIILGILCVDFHDFQERTKEEREMYRVVQVEVKNDGENLMVKFLLSQDGIQGVQEHRLQQLIR
jgi:hypothetical protein